MRKNYVELLTQKFLFGTTKSLIKKGFLLVIILCSLSFYANASSTVVFSENFDGWAGQTTLKGGTPEMTWVTFTTIGSDAKQIGYGSKGSRVFQIYTSSNMTTSGRSYTTGTTSTFLPLYKSKLKENVSDVVWNFNMRNSKATFPSHVNGLLELADSNYAQLMVLVASSSNLLGENTSGYAVTLTRDTMSTTIYKLVKFDKGLTATENLTTLIQSQPGLVERTNFASIRVRYSPSTGNWGMHVRDDAGNTAKDPTIENETNGYYTLIQSGVKDDTFTSTDMPAIGFFYNHGYKEPNGSGAKANFDNLSVSIEAEMADVSLADLKVSMDGDLFKTVYLFDSNKKNYQIYLTKNHPIPTVQATKKSASALDPVIVQATNLRGTQQERTAIVTVTWNDNSISDVYTVEFIETDNVYQTGMGNANGTTVGGGGIDFLPQGWTHSNMYFTGVVADGNNKYEGTAAARCALASTSAHLNLPVIKSIGTLKFYARKYESGVVGNISISAKADEGDWTVVKDFGDINNLTYQEFEAVINMTATDSLMVRVNITKNGDVLSSRGYFFDDFSYTGFGDESSVRNPTQPIDYQIRKMEGGLLIETENAQVNIFNTSGILLNSAHVQGSHTFKLNHAGTYIIRLMTNKGNVSAKYLHY